MGSSNTPTHQVRWRDRIDTAHEEVRIHVNMWQLGVSTAAEQRSTAHCAQLGRMSFRAELITQ